MVSRRAVLAAAATTAPTGAAHAASAFLEAWLAPKPRPWPRWEARDPLSTRRVDHSIGDRFLAAWRRRRPDGVAAIAYGAVGRGARDALDSYLGQLGAERVSDFARPEQFAFWCNLYNAATIKLVLDAYPVASIRDIDLGGGVLARGPWDARIVAIEGEPLTLNDIEHRNQRPIWQDPFVHYALNCASIGCPDIPPRAWSGADLRQELDRAARAFVNHPRGVSVDPDGLTVSSLYNW